MQNRSEFKDFLKDVKKTADLVSKNIENEHHAQIIIYWLVKMLKQLENNLNDFENLQKELEED